MTVAPPAGPTRFEGVGQIIRRSNRDRAEIELNQLIRHARRAYIDSQENAGATVDLD